MASHAVAILPWDAAVFLSVLLQLLGPTVSERPLDSAMLNDAYAAALSTAEGARSLQDVLVMLARSELLKAEGGVWQFTNRWQYDASLNDYVRLVR